MNLVIRTTHESRIAQSGHRPCLPLPIEGNHDIIIWYRAKKQNCRPQKSKADVNFIKTLDGFVPLCYDCYYL